MLKNISTLGKILNKSEKQLINGGDEDGFCPAGYCLNNNGGCTDLATAFFDDCAN
ncbi:hypothetical protein [Tenacibaculum aiptasiae]|uniref:hypothetical protein n=1 Tax=Tenacibaculum aiptasiae TaxID=426481 RepID=UPI00158818DB|nr:hypothetical protein [Tenacibaculum aiptasiae]